MALQIDLYNDHNFFYWGLLGVGNPTIYQNVSFDTGAHEIWIPNNEVYGVATPYLPHQSLTYLPYPGTVGRLRVRPYYFLNMRGIRRSDEFVCANHTLRSIFCVVDRVNFENYAATTNWTGVVGLSFPPPAPHFYVDPIWRTMMNNDVLQNNIFSFWLRDYDLFGDHGGAITFGAANVDHFDVQEGHAFHDIVDDSNEWMIHVSYVRIGQNQEILWGKALIHTGSPFIYGPAHIIRSINSQIFDGRRRRRRHQIFRGMELDQADDADSYEITMDEMATTDAMPHVSFVFHGSDRVYTLTPDEYILRKDGRYMTAFRPMDNQDMDAEHYVLGMPFLRRYHSIFNFEERLIGFAPSIP